MASGFAFDSPHDAVATLIESLSPVDERSTPLRDAFGMVLSRPIITDRDSPPHDVSAMDGYAVRASAIETLPRSLAVVDEVPIGQPAPPMPADGCLKIGTGACVPTACDGVIPREQVEESPTQITLPTTLAFRPGQHIRRQGENMKQGQVVVKPGAPITAPIASSLAAFGYDSVWAHRPVRVAVIATGNELLGVDATPKPWQIRDSNTSTLLAGLSNDARIEVVVCGSVEDTRENVRDALRGAAEQADLIVTTGGVSMGDHDYLKPALIDAGGEVVYHRLPIRPGKPSLGGWLVSETNQQRRVPVVALPGNPVAVSVGLVLFVAPVVRSLAGQQKTIINRPTCTVANPLGKTLSLWRYLPARLIGEGQAELIATKGSGDLASAALADGYIEMPPDAQGTGPWVFYDAT